MTDTGRRESDWVGEVTGRRGPPTITADRLVQLIADFDGVNANEFHRRYPAFQTDRERHVVAGRSGPDASFRTIVDYAKRVEPPATLANRPGIEDSGILTQFVMTDSPARLPVVACALAMVLLAALAMLRVALGGNHMPAAHAAAIARHGATSPAPAPLSPRAPWRGGRQFKLRPPLPGIASPGNAR